MRPKSFKLVSMAVPRTSVRMLLPKGHLPRVSRLSANDQGDNGMILGVVHRSPGIYPTAEDNLGKLLLGDRLM